MCAAAVIVKRGAVMSRCAVAATPAVTDYSHTSMFTIFPTSHNTGPDSIQAINTQLYNPLVYLKIKNQYGAYFIK